MVDLSLFLQEFHWIAEWKYSKDTGFIFLGSKITADGDCRHESKRCLLLERKTRQRIKKQRYYFAHIVKAMVFPIVMYGCESWTIKNAECQRIDAFKVWSWRRLLRVPWTARRSNQSILKEINPNIHWKDWCWNWSSNTSATWCEEPTHWRRKWQPTLVFLPGESQGLRSLVGCRLWGHTESDTTEAT